MLLLSGWHVQTLHVLMRPPREGSIRQQHSKPVGTECSLVNVK
jgi:hypothetical protein